ncbi:MAG: DNA adenine methylase [Microcystaceae cyanobacterium]
MKTNRTVVPPIKCQGIKTKLVPWIRDSMLWNNQGKWIEPFMGSGVVGFNVNPKNALFCDNNPHLIDFYNRLKTQEIDAIIVRDFLEEEGQKLQNFGQDYYYEVRKRFNQNKSSLDFLFLNRSCFNGVIRFNKKGGFNVPFCHKPNRFSKAYITKIVNQVTNMIDRMKINNWQFKVQSYTETLKQVQENDFIYCDPPYLGRHTDYFNCWQEEDEKNLYFLMKALPCSFILSTWHSNEHRNNEYLKKYWQTFKIITQPHFYHIGAKESNRKPMLEALVLNYNPYQNKSTDKMNNK